MMLSTASDCMLNFGPNYGDKETRTDLEKKILIGQDIQLHDGIYDSFYVSVLCKGINS